MGTATSWETLTSLTPWRTHISDALGYKLAYESALVQKGGVIRHGL